MGVAEVGLCDQTCIDATKATKGLETNELVRSSPRFDSNGSGMAAVEGKAEFGEPQASGGKRSVATTETYHEKSMEELAKAEALCQEASDGASGAFRCEKKKFSFLKEVAGVEQMIRSLGR